jgi:filamentous hemagglutinin family protein
MEVNLPPRIPQAARRSCWRRRAVALWSGCILFSAADVVPAQQVLPAPCVAGSCGSVVPFVSSGSASYAVSGALGVVTQQSERAILNWQSFNIGAGNTVNFLMPSADSSALNRIYQQDPSRILGNLNATGHVYLINQNGIVFGQGAQVNVGSLTASTLNVSDAVFNDIGVINAINQGAAAFEGSGTPGNVTLEAGATIRAAEGGRVMLLAPEVTNRGTITTPGGQAILAASSDRVYLASSDDPNLRGLLVEVDTGGTVANFGEISADRGNVTLLGLAVNQAGVARATTSVSVNGSVHLLARDHAVVQQGASGATARATQFGTVVLGADSSTTITPDAGGETAIDEQVQARSQVLLEGREVSLQAGASIVAPSGVVELTAKGGSAGATAGVFLHAGSRIDVSGTTVELPMSRNFVDVELRGNELRDAPLQRDGALRNETVTVDVRKGTPLADVSGALAGIRRDVNERMVAGGDIRIESAGQIDFAASAEMNVSGGSIRYADGLDTSSMLMSGGELINISEASPDRNYDAVFGTTTVVDRKWGVTTTYSSPVSSVFEAGYVEGKDAGSISMLAADYRLDGDMIGERVIGAWQRLPSESLDADPQWSRPFDQLPLGGLLRLDISPASALPLVLQSRLQTAGSSAEVTVPVEIFERGFTRADLGSAAGIHIPEGQSIELAAGGELVLRAGSLLDIGGQIIAPGGSVIADGRNQGGGATEIVMRSGALIDVRGGWVNDALDVAQPLLAPLHVDGGRVILVTQDAEGAALRLEAGSVIDASGGGYLDEDGSLLAGRGGDITLGARRSAFFDTDPSLRLDGELRSYAFEQGGRLTLFANGLSIGGAAPTAGTLHLDADYFTRGGFSAFDLNAQADDLLIANDTLIRPRAQNLIALDNLESRPTGSDVFDLAVLGVLDDALRRPVDLAFTLKRPALSDSDGLARVELGAGAVIDADIGSSVSFTSDGSILLRGSVFAPAGSIAARITAPTGLLDQQQGFSAEQGIWLDSAAQLVARGAARIVVEERGLRQGSVLDGGQIVLTADRGYIVASGGSLMDVSGFAATVDIADLTVAGVEPVYQPLLAAGAGGEIRLTAAEGMLLNGQLQGAAAPVSGAAGGSLSLTLQSANRGADDPVQDALFYSRASGPRVIELRADSAPVMVGFGAAVPDTLNGLAVLPASALADGGFDSVELVARSVQSPLAQQALFGSGAVIRLQGDVDLALRRELLLDAPVLASSGGSASLSAAYVSLGSTQSLYRDPVSPTTGSGSLQIDAQLLELVGDITLQGFGSALGSEPAVALRSQGDIRLRGLEVPGDSASLTGSFNVTGEALFESAQLYATTLSDYTIWAQGVDSRLVFRSNGGAASTPLSAASRLTLAAANIEQHGTIKAPFGEIRFGNFIGGGATPQFGAAERIELGAGSLTSVSGDGATILFGQIEFGKEWVYKLGSENVLFNRPPDKLISLDAETVATRAGSVVDVSGGGDLLAFEFAPGPGGSSDILLGANNGESFAIVPGLASEFAPFDPIESQDADIAIGDVIELAASEGLPAGRYAVLPARYALLPGAFLVTPADGYSDLSASSTIRQLDGSHIVAGRLAVAGTDIVDSRSSGFRVESGAQLRTRAEYTESLASDFFPALDGGSPLPRDAGRLLVGATSELVLNGSVAAAGVSGGRGAQLDIAANNIAVVAARGGSSGGVEVVASELNLLGIESLVLGGLRSTTDDGIELDVRANSVSVNDGALLSGPEVILVAGSAVTLRSGSAIESVGSNTTSGADFTAADDSVNPLGAFLRVASGDQATVETTGSGGRTTVEAGAVLRSTGSVALAASEDTISRGQIAMNGGSLSLAASVISIGDSNGAANAGLQLSEADLALLTVDELVLRSRSVLELYGDLNLDVTGLQVDARGVRGHLLEGESVTINADSMRFTNTGLAGASAGAAGSGMLVLNANELILDEGSYALAGFAATAVNAQTVRGSGVAALGVDGDLAVDAGLITATAGADLQIAISGSAAIASHQQPVAASADDALGASLDLTASDIVYSGNIRIASGAVTLRARNGGIALQSPAVAGVTASIDVSGRDLAFADAVIGSAGGQLQLIADSGPISVGDLVRLDVSAGTSGGDAGAIVLTAPDGAISIASSSQWLGTAAATQRGGSLQLDADSLGGVSLGAIGLLAANGGFNEALLVRSRQGDLTLGVNDVLRAREITLTADGGRIDVQGTLDANAASAGRVDLNAAQGLTIADSARILARASDAERQGGEITLASTAGLVEIRSGAVIDASGTLRLRAARSVTNDGLAVAVDPGAVQGAERVVLEAVRVYDSFQGAPVSSIDAGLIALIAADTDVLQQSAAAILSALGVGADPRFEVAPGIEIRSTGALTLASAWDLMALHYSQGVDPLSGQTIYTTERAVPGSLTLRAAGNLDIAATLSDGFALTTDPLLWVQGDNIVDGRSYDIRLVAGADLESADVTAVRAGAGNLLVGSGVAVRTGTGDIEMSAGGDLRMADTTAAVYVAGRASGHGTMPAELASLYLPGAYPIDGGNIRIAVAGSIYGPQGAQSDQLITEWLHRTGGPSGLIETLPTAWAIQFADALNGNRALFRQNVGSFGGGDVVVRAGGNIENFSVVLPTTGKQVGDIDWDITTLSLTVNESRIEVLGGGDLTMDAGGDLLGGVYYLGAGEGRLRAGGSITGVDATGSSGHPVLALGDATIELQARGDVTLQAAFNPTVLPKSFVQPFNQGGMNSFFFTYSEDSRIGLTSIAGDVRVLNETTALEALVGSSADPDTAAGFATYPASFDATSLQGSILFDNPFGSLRLATFPSAQGGLNLLANQDVRVVSGSATLTLSDADLNLWPSIERPIATALADALAASEHAPVPIHSSDPDDSRIIAREGLVGSSDTFSVLRLSLAEPVRIHAGTDVANLRLSVQHDDTSDISIVQAARDVVFPSIRSPLPPGSAPPDTAIRLYRGAFVGNSQSVLEVAGPGELQVLSGRDIDLGTSIGIRTVGNINNSALSDDGADLTLVAGLNATPDYAAFIDSYLTDDTEYLDELREFLTRFGVVAGADPVAAFRNLPQEQQRQLLFDVLMSELRQSGVAAAVGDVDEYERGFQAIETLFPESGGFDGDLSLILSRVATLDGGDIRLLVPGGMVNAGLATAESLSKRASELGIVAQRTGSIEAFVRDDFLVNQSRVFALDGGDILIWSSAGDIDAGRGAKTAISAPPPNVSFDADGNTVIEFPPAISGSGIRGAITTPGRAPGNVYLFAPAGVVDAGDAGIASAGNVTIAATEVIGADNIDVGGVAVGVPVDSSGLGASLASVSATASSATSASAANADTGGESGQQSQVPLAQAALSWLEVFVLGLGEETCAPDDVECLKRQGQ